MDPGLWNRLEEVPRLLFWSRFLIKGPAAYDTSIKGGRTNTHPFPNERRTVFTVVTG